MWESGFISIPHNFRMKDLQPHLQRLLAGSSGKLASAFVGNATPAEAPFDAAPSDSETSGDEAEEPQTILEALQQAAEQRKQEKEEQESGPQQWPGLTIDSNWGSSPMASPAAARAVPPLQSFQRQGRHRWGMSQRQPRAATRGPARLGARALWRRI